MIYNIAGYLFVELADEFLIELKTHLFSALSHLIIKGTILLSREGINCFLAGDEKSINAFQQTMECFSCFSKLVYKYSYSETIPFKKLVIKIRKEIIVCNDLSIKPYEEKASYLSPTDFQEWYRTKRDMIVLDTRNKFEFDRGHFVNAEHLNLENFREFEKAVKQLPPEYKLKPIVTYCTGGIRCEKAALILQNHGFKQAYQLEGGILLYFEQCGGEYYEGDCFVFDDRIAVDSELKPVDV